MTFQVPYTSRPIHPAPRHAKAIQLFVSLCRMGYPIAYARRLARLTLAS